MTATRSQPGPFRRRAALVLLLLVAPNFGWAQANAPAVSAPLPHAAQEALNKGIIAAKVPDYLLAIRFFQDARKLAPAAPVILLNLGIAEAKIAGRELRAMAWFGAYLAAAPDAPNAAAVKEQIVMLDVKTQSMVSRLINAVQDAARQNDRRGDLDKVAGLWAKAGDVPAALKIAERQQATYLVGNAHTYVVIAQIQAERGDSPGAHKTLNFIRDAYTKTGALLSVAESQARRGSIADAKIFLASAQTTAHLINDSDGKNRTRTDIANTQARIAGAVANLPNVTRQSDADTKPAILLLVAVSDWLKRLDDTDQNSSCPLNTAPFLNLSGYIKSLPTRPLSGNWADSVRSLPPENPVRIFISHHELADKIITAKNVVDRMLEQQAKR